MAGTVREAIESIGKFLTGDEERDAIHVAVLPVVAGEDLYAGDPVAFAFGTTKVVIRALDDYGRRPSVGIIDPYLRTSDTASVRRGTRVWLFMHPNTVTGIRHHWRHPQVDQPTPEASDSERWLHDFAERWGFDYDEMIVIATTPSACRDWITAYGRDLHSAEDLGKDHDVFWQNLARVTGRSYDAEHQRLVKWSCSC